MHGQAHTAMVPDSTKDGQPTKDLTNGPTVRGDRGHRRHKYANCFEVIEIADDSNPYLALLGIDWAMDMNGIINLKRQKMTFEKKSLGVVVPLDPAERERYIEPVRDEESNDELDCIYQMTAQDQDRMC